MAISAGPVVGIIASVTDEHIVVFIPGQDIVPCPAIKRVVTSTARDRVRACTSGYAIVALVTSYECDAVQSNVLKI